MSDEMSMTYEAWRGDFRHRVKQELLRRKMRQLDLAQAIGFANSSSVNYHLAGRGPSLDFVRRIAQLWPETFGSEMELYLSAVHGRQAGDNIATLHQRNIMVALDELDAGFTELRRAIAIAFRNYNDDVEREAGEG